MSFLARGSARTLASRLRSASAAVARRSYTSHSQLPEEHRMLYEMCRRFADEEIAPNAREWDQKHEFPNKMKELVRN
jgi:alkylation response protein AidB-like acyl-CoA dehydrogenase